MTLIVEKLTEVESGDMENYKVPVRDLKNVVRMTFYVTIDFTNCSDNVTGAIVHIGRDFGITAELEYVR